MATAIAPTSFSMNYAEGENLRASFSGPSHEAVKALIVDIRVFLLKQEPLCFQSVLNNVFRNEADDTVRKMVIESRAVWSKLTGEFSGAICLQVGGEELHGKRLLDIWLNGEIFHLDSDKSEFLEQINATPIGPLSYFCLVDLIQKMALLIVWFDERVLGPIMERVAIAPAGYALPR